MRADAVRLAVRSNRSIASVGNDVREPLRLDAEVVIGQRTHPAAAQMRHEFAPGRPALELRVFPNIGDLEKIFFVPRSRAADRERWRVNRVRLPEEFRHIAIKRHVWRGMLESRLTIHKH